MLLLPSIATVLLCRLRALNRAPNRTSTLKLQGVYASRASAGRLPGWRIVRSKNLEAAQFNNHRGGTGFDESMGAISMVNDI